MDGWWQHWWQFVTKLDFLLKQNWGLGICNSPQRTTPVTMAIVSKILCLRPYVSFCLTHMLNTHDKTKYQYEHKSKTLLFNVMFPSTVLSLSPSAALAWLSRECEYLIIMCRSSQRVRTSVWMDRICPLSYVIPPQIWGESWGEFI